MSEFNAEGLNQVIEEIRGRQAFRQESSAVHHAIHLLKPAEGSVTRALQRYAWQQGREKNQPAGDMALLDKPEAVWSNAFPEDDCSQPHPVEFAWEPLAVLRGTYEIEIQAEDDSREKWVVNDLLEPRVLVSNLRIGTQYTWQVRAFGERGLVGRSVVGRFSTNPEPPRWISVPGVTNVRDLGGWAVQNAGNSSRVRQGMVFRGSEMNSHCTISEAGRRVLVDHLGIRTDIDLRGVGEDRASVLDTRLVEYINVPLASYDMIANPEFTGRYRALFHILATPSVYPVFIHCWGGADRTGTVAFLLGALLGMSKGDLCKDYELTSLSIWGERLCSSEGFQEMLRTLEVFARRGSSLQAQVERYLQVIGVSEGDIHTIRDLLVE